MTKTEILKAAFTAWGRELYLNTSLTQVARELGVSKPALYRHIKNKDDLLDAMAGQFLDEFAAFLREHNAPHPQDDSEVDIFSLIRITAEYFAQNVNMFFFSFVRLYKRRNCSESLMEALQSRGVDFAAIQRQLAQKYGLHPHMRHIIFMTLTFFMAVFHNQHKSLENPPSKKTISKKIDMIIEIIERGLGYTSIEIRTLDYKALETRVEGTVVNIKDSPLLKAVVEAVAEAGPWEASMEQVARRSGLSKSSLYGHFKSKHDMLRQLFITEFLQIVDFAVQGMGHSAVPQERVYLGIFSIAEYLRSRPDFLVAMDWIRTRRLDFSKGEHKQDWEDGLPPDFPKLFEDIEIKPFSGGERFDDEKGRRRITHWILFLIINILMLSGGKEVKNEDIRFLYRFLTLGIGGFAS